jgi:hypothetical protein
VNQEQHKLQLATDVRSVRRLLVAACVVPGSPIFVTLMKEAPGYSETSVLTRATWRNNPEDTILQRCNMSPVKYELGFYIPEDCIFHSHRRESLKSYTDVSSLLRISSYFRNC